MVAIYDQVTGERTSLAPIPDYDHPAYIDGWEAAKENYQPYSDHRIYVYDNPNDPLTEPEAFIQWRQGYWAYEDAHSLNNKDRANAT